MQNIRTEGALDVFSSSAGPNSAATISTLRPLQKKHAAGDFGQDHPERMPWDREQLMLPLNIHLLSCHPCHKVEALENCRTPLVIKVNEDLLFKFASSLTRQFWND